MATFAKAAVGAKAHTLLGRYYTSPEIFKHERERIFARRWVCVGREERIPEAGSFFVADVAGESLIIIRDATGALHAHFNVCRHRGSRVCEQASGRFKGSIVCPYHAWTYGLDGRLMAARNMRDVPDFDESLYPLRSAHLVAWEGFIFVNLGERPEPFDVELGGLVSRYDRWNIAGLREARRVDYTLACNWKFVFQNYSECYHCPLVHPQLDKLSPADSGRNDLHEGPVLGGYMTLRHPGGSMTLTGATERSPLPGLNAEDRDRVYYYVVFPSMLLSLHPDYVMAHFVRPVSIDRTDVTCVWLFDPHEMQRAAFDPSDAVEFWDMTNRQDWHVCELSQQGVSSRMYTPGPYSHAEGLLHAFDKHYLSTVEPL